MPPGPVSVTRRCVAAGARRPRASSRPRPTSDVACDRQVRRVRDQRAQRREVGSRPSPTSWKRRRAGQVLEPVLAEVAKASPAGGPPLRASRSRPTRAPARRAPRPRSRGARGRRCRRRSAASSGSRYGCPSARGAVRRQGARWASAAARERPSAAASNATKKQSPCSVDLEPAVSARRRRESRWCSVRSSS